MREFLIGPSKMLRTNGYYWIKFNKSRNWDTPNGWEIGHYKFDPEAPILSWCTMGSDNIYDEQDIAEVGSQIFPPE
jgi:hypothetical protein